MGFRCKYEYDVKAILLCSDQEVVVMTYTLETIGESPLDNLVNQHQANGLRLDDDDSEEDEYNIENPSLLPKNKGINESKQAQAEVILRW